MTEKLNIGNNNRNADWLKNLRSGKYKKQDLKAHEDAQKKHDRAKDRNQGTG